MCNYNVKYDVKKGTINVNNNINRALNYSYDHSKVKKAITESVKSYVYNYIKYKELNKVYNQGNVNKLVTHINEMLSNLQVLNNSNEMVGMSKVWYKATEYDMLDMIDTE